MDRMTQLNESITERSNVGYLQGLPKDYYVIYEPGIHVLRITGTDGKSVDIKWRVYKMTIDLSPRISISEVLFGQYVVYSGINAAHLSLTFRGAHGFLAEIGKKLVPIIGSPTKVLLKLEYNVSKKWSPNEKEPLRLLFADERRAIKIATDLVLLEHAVLKKATISLATPLIADLSLNFSIVSQF